MTMFNAKDAAVWINRDTREVVIGHAKRGRPSNSGHWCDPIGGNYGQWKKMSNDQRMNLMVETAIGLAMEGFSLREVLVVFAQVIEFRELGDKSFPMCRALRVRPETSGWIAEFSEHETD